MYLYVSQVIYLVLNALWVIKLIKKEYDLCRFPMHTVISYYVILKHSNKNQERHKIHLQYFARLQLSDGKAELCFRYHYGVFIIWTLLPAEYEKAEVEIFDTAHFQFGGGD